ncbi:glutamine ABC transporter permease [Kurthia zopfii]|uniref:Amino acid ABC transporter membrane protein (PAAT family) n=1 Tax=Kurthia zopfii TaxID=1650 RepID=A0A2U3A9R5_9BACL|nr:amino acid ABC transporter permease [Kurthia zopfii]PWI21293.1 nickel transporter [Kurthia zopfii]TDR34062.1 amino acid ABC transporter membrane protein (PAAT family) [Kurthia zopfii]STX08718.1 Glutamine transport system permease protein glnP [Kurthia zopfii]VEI05064.1 Glutamine transport system permease protein glnP [Kurthia zopfii]GEK32460.1 glutamine ABC transporter permease [Kurthia zopfii]
MFNYDFDWSVIPENYDVLIEGALLTLEISAISLLLSLPIGLLFGFGRISKNSFIRFISSAYVEIMRGIPLLVLLMWIYFGLGGIFHLSSYWGSIISLALFEAAFLAEIFRSGVQAVPKGQLEAARSAGMSSYQAMRFIILPQAVRRILPPTASQFIILIKDSSLVSVISGVDLTLKAKNLVSSTYLALEIWTAVAIIYFIITFSLSLIIRYFEKRMLKNEL